jgi:sulfur relay (sulfurtransferase) DsrC/TusE family protein
VADGFRIPTIEIIGVEFVEEFIQLNSDMYPSLSMTIPKEYFQKLMPNLFIQGLTFVFDQNGDVKINNADLWNNALKKHLISAARDDKGKQLSANYLPVMLTVREYYQNEQNEEKIEELDIEIAKVVVQSKKQSVYSKLKE